MNMKPNDRAEQNGNTGQTKDQVAERDQQAAKTGEANASTSEVVEKNPKVFGNAEGKPGDTKTPLERQTGFDQMTADQRHAVENKGKPLNKPMKTEGRQIELGDRVILHTPNPIGGQLDNAAHVIGFNSDTGRPNLRLELLDGGAARPVEFGGVAQNQGDNPADPYWRWPEEFAAKKADK
jgi:hypothetical protein